MELETLFKKLNLKSSINAYIISAPDSIENDILSSDYKDFLIKDANKIKQIDFTLCFAKSRSELNDKVHFLCPKLKGDAILWFAYPKKSSKNYNSDLSRDNGWETLGKYNLEPVRQVSIDDDWSALRFRHINYIKQMTRNPNMLLSNKKQKSN